MSNIGNKLRAGFFATPLSQGKYIKELLSFTKDTSIFDPTAGEGEVLNFLAQDAPVTVNTYGVELDKARASKAEQVLTKAVQAPIESMIISNDVFGLLFLNPPYDHSMMGYGDEKTERKEYTELVRGTRYLVGGGVMIYIIPSYRFSDSKIARYLATHFEKVAIARFTDGDYEDFKQCIFIGHKKNGEHKAFNESVYNFLTQMDDEKFIKEKVTPIDRIVGHRTWEVPGAKLEIPTFYSRIQNKSEFIEGIKHHKGFDAFKNYMKPKSLELGGQPIINIAQGQLALLLASGAVNGVVGSGETLHAVQGLEIVSSATKKEELEDSTKYTTRTSRSISVKVITPSGLVKKLM